MYFADTGEVSETLPLGCARSGRVVKRVARMGEWMLGGLRANQ